MHVTVTFPLDSAPMHCALSFGSVVFTHDPSDLAYFLMGDLRQSSLKRPPWRLRGCIVDYSYEEGASAEEFEQQAQRIRSELGVDRLLWLLNVSCTATAPGTVLLVDHFLLQAQHLTQWRQFPPQHTRPRRGLCMTGKLSERPQRIQLLGELWHCGLWDRTLVSTLSTGIHNTGFGAEFERALVTPMLNAAPRWQDTSPGWPAPVEQMDHSWCSLVVETNSDQGSSRFITEKTMRTISNAHPFVVYGAAGTVDYLSSRGFDTFPDITGKYNTTQDAAAAVEAYARMLEADPARLQQGVDHNLARLGQLARSEQQKLDAALAAWWP